MPTTGKFSFPSSPISTQDTHRLPCKSPTAYNSHLTPHSNPSSQAHGTNHCTLLVHIWRGPKDESVHPTNRKGHLQQWSLNLCGPHHLFDRGKTHKKKVEQIVYGFAHLLQQIAHFICLDDRNILNFRTLTG